SGISLFATVLLAPTALVLLLGALPFRQGGTFAWFSVIEAGGIISLFGMAWAYGLFLAPITPGEYPGRLAVAL
uniref:hypothetical protein n=1 Tax=Methanoculleus chikugoensis TaxID=118126 RepID=UPI000AE066F1